MIKNYDHEDYIVRDNPNRINFFKTSLLVGLGVGLYLIY